MPAKKPADFDAVDAMRHSTAHVLAAAVMEMFPDAKLGVGPVIEHGFFYDVKVPRPLVALDLQKLEARMAKIVQRGPEFVREEMPIDDAIAMFKEMGQDYKVELLTDLKTRGTTAVGEDEAGDIDAAKPDTASIYRTGAFVDLCRGPHVASAKEIGAFKLRSVAGAYWRGKQENDQLQRIYGIAFPTKGELEAHLKMLEEAEKRDHRLLGEKLDLFHFDEQIGKGLPIWLPNGNVIKEELETWAKETEEAWGYQRVTTPIITKENLFYTSGHLPLYKESMYAPIAIEEENYYIKPMNCPFHHRTFAARPKSYRDLPVRYAEYGWCHRYEDSGALFGMMRVRGMQMNDAHIYVRREDAVEEFVRVIKLHEHYYKILGIKDYEMELALRDPKKMDKYHGDEADWKDAEAMTVEAMEKSGVRFKVVNEGAAFYGPKMDFQIYSSIGRAFTASTNQLDLFMGKRFGLEYTDSDGQKKTPAIIHRAPLGTHERFVGFLIEHFAGAFPAWLAPVQVQVMPVGKDFTDVAQKLAAMLRAEGMRVKTDDGGESVGYMIRNAERMRIPYMLVIGEKEKGLETLTVRIRGEKDEVPMSVAEFIGRAKEKIAGKALTL